MIKDKEFLNQFKDYSDTYKILGVRIPQVNIGTSYAKKFGLDVDVRFEGRDIEEVYENANDKFQDSLNVD